MYDAVIEIYENGTIVIADERPRSGKLQHTKNSIDESMKDTVDEFLYKSSVAEMFDE